VCIFPPRAHCESSMSVFNISSSKPRQPIAHGRYPEPRGHFTLLGCKCKPEVRAYDNPPCTARPRGPEHAHTEFNVIPMGPTGHSYGHASPPDSSSTPGALYYFIHIPITTPIARLRLIKPITHIRVAKKKLLWLVPGYCGYYGYCTVLYKSNNMGI
jgi:hypothetical protein